VSVILSQLLRLGLDGVVLRESSRFEQSGNRAALRTFSGDVLVYLTVGGSAIVLAGKLAQPYAAPLLFSGASPFLLYETALYAFVPFTLVWTGASLLKGIGKTSLSVFVEAGSVPLLVLLLLQMQAGAPDYRQAVDALLWANAIAAVATVALVIRYAGCSIVRTGLLQRCRKLFAESLKGVWVAISNTLIVWAPLLFLGMLATPADVGLYNAAFRVTMLIGAFSPVFKGVATPRLAALLHRNESPVPFLKQSMTRMLYAGLLLLLVGELAFEHVFAYFGPGFASAAGLATLMLVGMLANVLFVVMETQLILAERNDLLRSNTIFTVLITLPLSLMLINAFQAYGAALAFVVINVLSRAGMLWLFNRVYGCRI
jgi:O-antigen/teichoic acid export membrane protein